MVMVKGGVEAFTGRESGVSVWVGEGSQSIFKSTGNVLIMKNMFSCI